MKNFQQSNPYEDIIHLSRPISKKHPPMPIEKRAAQFSPFAALSGYSSALKEVTRYTEEKRTLSQDEKAFLDQKFNILMGHLEENPEITVTYFMPDAKKKRQAVCDCYWLYQKNR